MAILQSRIDAGNPAFAANSRHHRALSDELKELTARIVMGGR